MRKVVYGLLAVVGGVMLFSSCNRGETYAEQKDREREAINALVVKQGIKVISESEFLTDTATDVSKNEFVLFDNTGVYMQIVKRGTGEKIADGETTDVLCRFKEANLFVNPNLSPDSCLTNTTHAYAYKPDKLTVTNNSGTFTASFLSGLMYDTYKTTSVPSGWLIPLTYIKLDRLKSASSELAKVRLIVPHTQGQQNATQNVYPCYYEISYEKGR